MSYEKGRIVRQRTSKPQDYGLPDKSRIREAWRNGIQKWVVEFELLQTSFDVRNQKGRKGRLSDGTDEKALQG